MDPVTTGAFVSWALGVAAEAMGGVVNEGVKDAYAALKSRLAHWASDDVDALEKAPASKARQAVVAETVDALAPTDQAALQSLAKALAEQLRQDAALVGLDIDKLRAAEVQLGDIDVAQGVGARIRDADVQGAFKVGNISVGERSGKA